MGELETSKASNNLRNGTRKNVINSLRLTTQVGSNDASFYRKMTGRMGD